MRSKRRHWKLSGRAFESFPNLKSKVRDSKPEGGDKGKNNSSKQEPE
jgi:hypothetical protein